MLVQLYEADEREGRAEADGLMRLIETSAACRTRLPTSLLQLYVDLSHVTPSDAGVFDKNGVRPGPLLFGVWGLGFRVRPGPRACASHARVRWCVCAR